MCRTPIIIRRCDINSLDPAIAEQDIVDFVKQYETCGLCDLKTNPNLKCDECRVFVCESCEKCHKTLKPLHKVISILPSGTSRILSTKRTCVEHADQSLDLFCIVCHRVLCMHCKEYCHAKCEQNTCVEFERYCRGFLNDYVQSNENLKIKFNSKQLSRVVYIPGFVTVARKWLEGVQVEVHACMDYFRELKAKLTDIEATFDNSVLTIRRQVDKNEIDKILKFGKDSLSSTEHLLNEETPDIEIAKNVLNVEQKCLTVFKYRRAFPLDMEPFKLIEKNTGSDKQNIQQLSKCFIKECTVFTCKCVLNIMYCAKPADHLSLGIHQSEATEIETTGKTSVNNIDISGFTILSCAVFEKLLFNGKLTNNYSRNRVYKQAMHQLSAHNVESNIYTNHVLDKSELRKLNSLEICMIQVDVGFTDEIRIPNGCGCTIKFDIDNTVEEKPQVVISYDSLRMGLITKFVNVVVLPCYSVKEMESSMQGNHSESRGPYLFSLIGNRERGAGLESVFLYVDSDGKLKHGVSICSTVAKFKSSAPVYLNDLLNHTHQQRPGYIIKDENGAFYVFTCQHGDSYWLSYHSKLTADVVPENFIQSCENFGPDDIALWISLLPHLSRRYHQLNTYGKEVLISIFKTNLLCSFESGIYFVKRNDAGEMTIGTFLFNCTEIKPDTMLTVRASDTYIPLCKLKPLTMVERRNKAIVVVCSVEDDTSKFVMILADKQGAEAVEVLKINYASSKLTVHPLADTGNATSGEAGQTANIAETKSPKNTEPVISREATTSGEATSEEPEDRTGNITESTSLNRIVAADLRLVTKRTEPAILTTKETKASEEANSPITEYTLQKIAEATVIDLEMDQDGNIVFLLDTKDKERYCVCTKYFMP